MTPSMHSFADEMLKIADSKKSLLFSRLRKESPVEVKRTQEAKELGGGYFDTAGDGHIGISDHRLDSLAHEIGHAKNHQTIWGKFIQSIPAKLAYELSPLAGGIAGIALARGKKWPLIIPVAAVAPVLLAEALATNTGHKVLKKVKASPEEIAKYRANLRSSFATYLQTPVAAAAVGTLTHMLTNAIFKKN